MQGVKIYDELEQGFNPSHTNVADRLHA